MIKDIWILVANRSVAKLFESRSIRDGLELIKTISNPYIVPTEKTPHDRDADAFARHLAFMLDRDRSRGRFDELVLVAEPGFLGKLRAYFGKRAGSLGHVRTVNKELVHVSAKNLRLHLNDVLLELWRDPRRPIEHRHTHLRA
ncbi:MAG: host attachment protein [Bdellovibrionota bacterium]